MTTLSHNEEGRQQMMLKHFFLPNYYGLMFEVVLSIMALVIFNLSQLSSQLLTRSQAGDLDPLALWGKILGKALGLLQRYGFISSILLFMIWALVGALIYVFLFRLLQIFVITKDSINQGVSLMRADNTHGLVRWLASLHDIFLRLLLTLAAVLAVLFGTLVCFGVASQELTLGLSYTFPDNVLPLLISLVGALLCVRLIVISLSLTSARFRGWYLY